MFWTIVGALIFVFFIFPIIIYVAVALFGVSVEFAASESGQQTIGWGCAIIIGIIVVLWLIGDNNNRRYQETQQQKQVLEQVCLSTAYQNYVASWNNECAARAGYVERDVRPGTEYDCLLPNQVKLQLDQWYSNQQFSCRSQY